MCMQRCFGIVKRLLKEKLNKLSALISSPFKYRGTIARYATGESIGIKMFFLASYNSGIDSGKHY